MSNRGTIILDEPCAALREVLQTIAPVFVFKRRQGFLATPANVAADELKNVLATNQVPAPHFIVAASFGGFAALAYASQRPLGLAGMVLIDPSHPDQAAAVSAAIPEGEARLPSVEKFRTYLQGFGPVWTDSCQFIAGIPSLGDLPLIVLGAGKPDLPPELTEPTRRAVIQSWHDLQRQHAARSTRGQLRLVPNSGHNILATAPHEIFTAVESLVTAGNA